MCRVRDLNPRTFVTDLKTVALTNSANPTQLLYINLFRLYSLKKKSTASVKASYVSSHPIC